MNSRGIVCFDLGGVIVRIARSWTEGCAAAGLPVRGDSHTNEMKVVRQTITQSFMVGMVSQNEWAAHITESLQGLYSQEEIIKIHDGWIIEEYPGWEELVDDLHAAHITTACLSNTNEGHWRRMLHLHEDGKPRTDDPAFPNVMRLQHLHASHLIKCAKPDAGIYAAFEESMRCNPHDILFFDDLEDNVQAAHQRGWRVVQIDHTRSTVPQVRASLKANGFAL